MSDSRPPRRLVILGATATGKTELAVAVAARAGGEIVNVDASCLHRGLSVGLAKPGPAERAAAPHHLLDVLAPDEWPTAAAFVALAEVALADIAARGRLAILVGGSGLYLRALLRGLAPSAAANSELRRRLHEIERGRPGRLHRLLARLDPRSAHRIDPKNAVRLVRAIEHRLVTGRRLSEDQRQWGAGERFQVLKIGLALPRLERERRIAARVDAMLAGGLVQEVARLIESGVPASAPVLRAVGHADVVRHLRGELAVAELRERLVVATRQLAKRQDTWFRREPDVTWLPSPATVPLEDLVEAVVARLADAPFSQV